VSAAASASGDRSDPVLRRAGPADAEALAALKTRAYLPNEAIIGVTSLPRMADYRTVVAEKEAWIVDGRDGPDAAVVFETADGRFTLWSIAVAARAAGRGLGSALMRFTEERAATLGFDAVHLYTHERLAERIGWYGRLGYALTHYEALPDRRLAHMRKALNTGRQDGRSWQDV